MRTLSTSPRRANVSCTKDVLTPFIERREPIVQVVGGEDFPAAAAGFKPGDRITTVNGQPIVYWHEFKQRITENEGAENTIEVERDGVTEIIKVTPNEDGVVGINIGSGTRHISFSFGEAVTQGTSYGYNILNNKIYDHFKMSATFYVSLIAKK